MDFICSSFSAFSLIARKKTLVQIDIAVLIKIDHSKLHHKYAVVLP